MADLFGDKKLLTQRSFEPTSNYAVNNEDDHGTVIAQEALTDKVVCLFFSASWCAPCQHFVPVLKDIYTELCQRGEPLEIVFLSFDKTKEDMMNYYRTKHGDWLAVEFGDPIRDVFAERYSISVIPKLIVIQPSGDVITSKGRKDIQDKGIICMRGWRQGLISKDKHEADVANQQPNEDKSNMDSIIS